MKRKKYHVAGNLSLAVTRGAGLLQEDAVNAVKKFAAGSQNSDGGFRGRSGESDLYYTYYAAEVLTALDETGFLEKTGSFLEQFTDPSALDFVHLISFIRCLCRVSPGRLTGAYKKKLGSILKTYKARKGGYNRHKGVSQASLYDTFLYCLAALDLGLAPASMAGIVLVVQSLELDNGSFSGNYESTGGTVSVTASALALLTHLDPGIGNKTAAWLLDREAPGGGFYASRRAPVPDLLSTAVSLFALREAGCLNRGLANRSMDFIETCFDDAGGFFASPLDTYSDIEYTYYGLLAMGSLIP